MTTFNNALNNPFPQSLANGGTGANLTAVAGAVAYSTASGMAFTAAGTAAFPLISQGSSAPVFSSIIHLAAIEDTNANTVLTFTANAGSGVNHLQMESGISGVAPFLAANGSDTNIALTLKGKGNSGVPIFGYTDGSSAASGVLGEYMSATVLAANSISMTTETAMNVTSLMVTPGDWDVWGTTGFNNGGSGSPLTFEYAGWVSLTSATVPDASQGTISSWCNPSAINLSENFYPSVSTGTLRVTVSTNTTVYLGAYAGFTSSGFFAYGKIQARRRY